MPLAALLCASLAAAACSSSDASSGTPVPIEELGERLATALCPAMGDCCRRSGYPHDPADCEATMRADVAAQLARLSDPERVRYDAAAAGECVAAYARHLEACEPLERDAPGALACNRIFVGMVPPGAPCRLQIECAAPEVGTVTCAPASPGDQLGRCTVDPDARPPVRRAEGEECRDTCDLGPSGQACKTTGPGVFPRGVCFLDDGLECGESGRCERAPRLGEPCTLDCTEDAFCDGGVCVARRETGSCRDFFACSERAFCDVATQECLPRHGVGDPCESGVQCASGFCREDGTCREDLGVRGELCAGYAFGGPAETGSSIAAASSR